MAQKRFELKFDIDAKDVEIVSDKTLTLTEQVRILKKELQKDDKTPEQFSILANKLNETKDAAAATEARSRELFGTLQLIPGPIGDIASKIDGTISLLKTFSSFSVKDLKAQFVGLIGDITSLVKWMGNATGITKIYTVLNRALAASFVAVGVGEQAAAVGARAFAAALTATGVGALVVALGMAAGALIEFASSSDDAALAQKQLNDEIAKTNQLLDLDLAGQKRVQQERLALLRKNGASEKTIREQGIKDLKEDLSITSRALAEARQTEINARGKGEEALKAAQDNVVKIEQKQKDLVSQIRVANIENLTQTNEEAKQIREKNAEEEQKFLKDKIDNQKEALDNQIELELNSLTTSEKNLTDLLNKRRKFDEKELDEAKVQANKLLKSKKITSDEFNNLVAGIEAKRMLLIEKNKKQVQDAIQEDKKVDEERIKNQEEFQKKLRDLQTAAIIDDIEREKQARLDRYNDELNALERDKEFIKLSEEQKQQVRLNIKSVYEREIKKIDDDARKKSLDDERKGYEDRLRILELQGQGLLAGTKLYYDNRKAILDESLAKELVGVEKGSAEELAIRKKYADLNKKLDEEKIASQAKVISATFDALGALTNALASSYDEEAKTSEAAFNKRKKLQKATAVMSAASGIIQILAQPSTLPSPFDWIVKGINAAALAISTAVNIKKIDQTKFEAPAATETPSPEPYKVTATRASGGIISGPGTSTSDSIPARLSNGEYVVNARATTAFLPLLNAINDAGRQPRFAMGGLYKEQMPAYDVADNISTAISSSLTMTPIKTYVVSQDMSNSQQFDRQRKSRSTL